MEWDVRDVLMEVLRRFGYLFYIMNPSEHLYEKIEDVRDYYKEVAVLALLISLVEEIFLLRQKKGDRYEMMSNTANIIITEMVKVPLRTAIMALYIWTYTNYRVVTLPSDSIYVWLLGLFAEDFIYYWVHRMNHEVNLIWALHETHHSPENITFASSLRNHMFYLSPYWVLINPTAFFIPPTIHFVHYQMVLVYQFWIHTEQIDKLPAVIEFIFNTPSHHRVHHGRNRKYIDKNFGAVFIIWDRIFGTYEEEDPNEKPIYGLTTQMKSFNPLVIQTRHFQKMWHMFWEYKGVGNKLSVIFKGPGWSPGKPRTGNLEDIPEPPPKFLPNDPGLPFWLKAYVWVHYSLFIVTYLQVALNLEVLSKVATFISVSYIVYSSIAIGFIMDKSRYAAPSDVIRCLMYFVMDISLYDVAENNFWFFNIYIIANRVTFGLSIIMWVVRASNAMLEVFNGKVDKLWFNAKFQRKHWTSTISLKKSRLD